MQDPTYAARNPRTGLIEVIDCRTGAVLAVQANDLYILPTALITHILPDGSTVQLQSGIDPGTLTHVRAWPYSQMTADLICQELASGRSLKKILSSTGFPPYHVFSRWRKDHPGFREQLEDARRDRAEMMRDEALEEALAADEDNVNSQKLKHEAYKWAAAIDDQVRYSQRTKVDATISAPTQILVHTGIVRTQQIDNTLEKINDMKEVAGGMHPNESKVIESHTRGEISGVMSAGAHTAKETGEMGSDPGTKTE